MVCDLSEEFVKVHTDSLNPCFNGIWSATNLKKMEEIEKKVLILVLMEYGLRQHLS